MYNLVVLAQQGHVLPLSIYDSFNVSHHEEQDVVVEKILKRYFLKSMKYCDKLLIGLYRNGTCKIYGTCQNLEEKICNTDLCGNMKALPAAR